MGCFCTRIEWIKYRYDLYCEKDEKIKRFLDKDVIDLSENNDETFVHNEKILDVENLKRAF